MTARIYVLMRDGSVVPDSSTPASRKNINGDDRQREPPEPVPLVCRAAVSALPRACSMFARSLMAPVWPGVESAAPPGFGIFGQSGATAATTGNDHMQARST